MGPINLTAPYIPAGTPGFAQSAFFITVLPISRAIAYSTLSEIDNFNTFENYLSVSELAGDQFPSDSDMNEHNIYLQKSFLQ